MTIIVNSISKKFGGSGGIEHNDFNDIITDQLIGGSINIKSINIKSVQISSGDVIDAIQFTYNVVTNDGVSHAHTGNVYGGTGGAKQSLFLANNEQIISIRGKYGKGVQYVIVGQLEILTTQTSHFYGAGVLTGDIVSFDFPAGVIFGSSGSLLDSIGAIQISEVPSEIAKQPPAAATATVTEMVTISPSGIPSALGQNNSASPNSTPLVICLSFTTAILGLYFIMTMGIFLWKKFHKVNTKLQIPPDRP